MLQSGALLCIVIVYVYVIISIIRGCCDFVIFIGYVCIYVRLHVCVCSCVYIYVCLKSCGNYSARISAPILSLTGSVCQKIVT